MPDILRALIVVLGIATAVFLAARSQACAVAMAPQDFSRRRNLWFGLTLAAFLAHNFWLFIAVATALLLFTLPREPNKVALYFMILFAVPQIPAKIPGFGVMEHFFVIHYVRLLALVLLLPMAVRLARNADTEPFGRLLADKLVAGYLVLQFGLLLSDISLTETLRYGLLYPFTDALLPYYVLSRSLRSLSQFRDALMAFVVAALVLAAIGCFEFVKQWLLYKEMESALGTIGSFRWAFGNYLLRGDSLRALGSSGQPIVFGYLLAIAMAFHLYLRRHTPSLAAWWLGMLLLAGGLIASMSRGPWMGAAALLLAFIALGPAPARNFLRLALVGAVVLPAVLLSPAGERVVDLLPFVGTVEEHHVTYRQRFIEVSLEVVKQNPLFGNRDFTDLAEMDELKPQGLLDTLNVFLTVALANGLVGLALFTGVLIATAAGIVVAMKRAPSRDDESYVLGCALLCSLVAIVVIINTVSAILLVPVMYWCIAGVGVAYSRLPQTARNLQPRPRADSPATPLRAGQLR